MKDKNKNAVYIFLIFVVIYFFLIFNTNIIDQKLNIIFIIIFILFFIYFLLKNNKIGSVTKNKLFSYLAENSDTVYIMIDSNTNKIAYLSTNCTQILGIQDSSILNLSILKNEFDNWNKKENYCSQMIEYDNPKLNTPMWIRIKLFLYDVNDSNNKYYVVQIIDATKEHDKQHLIISQASDIKLRELKLNQITSSSYDMEMNINLSNNSYEIKYFKMDNLYFGEERRETYTTGLNNIIENYINENDKDNFYSTFNLENLKDHFDKYEINPIVLRYRIGNKVKNNIWLESTIFFISNRQNNRISVLTKNVTEDALAIRQQNVLLQNALNEAKSSSTAKSELISTISHDIRTPLTNIIGLSDSLLNRDISKNIIDDIKNINTSSKDILDIVDGLIDTNNIEKKLIVKEEKKYNIFKMFTDIENNLKIYIENKNIDLKINLDSNLPVVLYGDCKRISRAITDILNNSLKYTDEGYISVKVTGTKLDNNVKLKIEIEDSGCGISNKKMESILSSNTSLGNIKKTIELLDGTFEIESVEGEYTKVIMSFMQKIVEDNKVRTLIDNNKSAEISDYKGKNIIVVDDNKLNLKVTKRLLEPFNVDVTLLESGVECIELIKEQSNFDLILMDQMMPNLTGSETLKKLKEIPNFNIPVVVLTADAMLGRKEHYLNEGFDDYISKPIDKLELSNILNKYLNGGKYE